MHHLLIATCIATAALTTTAAADWSFFPFQNATTDEAHPTPAAQVQLAKTLGFDGVGSVYPADVAGFAAACDHAARRLFNAYVVLPIDGAPPLPTELAAQLAPLQGRRASLWVGLTSKTRQPGDPDGDADALQVLTSVANLAESLGATVALYPHAGFWVERTEQAVAVAKRLHRPDVGVSFNLCHFLKVDAESRLETVVRDAAPWLRVVSLNGAESGHPGGTWQELIQPLDRGSFDNLRLLRALRGVGYTGPIGFQGYGIGGRAEANLQGTIAAWRTLNQRLDEESVAPTNLRFVPDANGGFRFDTGQLRGRLHADGRALGLTEVEHVPSGSRLDRSNGLLSHYRVFTRGVRYGAGAWDWTGAATLQPDGSVQVHWPAQDGRPFHLEARYRWVAPRTIDVQTSVTATEPIQGFESFLASYFDAAFTNATVEVRSPDAPGTAGLRLNPALGDWLMFPRDGAARELAGDGRWSLEPHPVAWVFPAEFAPPQAVAIRRAPALNLTATLTAANDGCFGIASPHELEGHYSTYLSLFGHDLRAGETARAVARLTIE